MRLQLRVAKRLVGCIVSERISDETYCAKATRSLMRILPYVRSVLGCATLKH
jgi:hypothetical protein